ncbi:hypothetical protein [Kitasatospora sp. A2-31]|uniref:hypothetical protein n=1 Tax=Kitasatospora sp. A2-31 TaxID=2916414 RepID=UPI001EE9E9CE|nr:hypothetical protein [Kitasatospora sp. A2-31]MCG6495096.1 hypothetical protein [Kitasatospora sp. A2-31]
MDATAAPVAAASAAGSADPGDAPRRPTLGELAEMAAADLGALLRRAGVEGGRSGPAPVAGFSSAA